MSVEFWSRVYSLVAGLKHENKIKWLQYQINRSSLFTNVKVHKFKPYISPQCSYCSNHPELIEHLFYSCEKVAQFWDEVRSWLATLQINLPYNQKQILFGINNETCFSLKNGLILYVKYFIWTSKFQAKQLSLNIFQTFLQYKLKEKRDAHEYCDNMQNFQPWNIVFDSLLRLLPCTTPAEAPMPTL